MEKLIHNPDGSLIYGGLVSDDPLQVVGTKLISRNGRHRGVVTQAALDYGATAKSKNVVWAEFRQKGCHPTYLRRDEVLIDDS